LARDIPFRAPLSIEEQGYACVAKPEILGRMLQEIGLETRQRVTKFRWEDHDLPDRILDLSHEDPETHEYLEVRIPETGRWVEVDPTWDSRIRHSKFPELEWDGKTGTGLAVEPVEKLSVKESKEFIQKDSTEEARRRYFEENKEFFRALNRWLESLRKSEVSK
jgi:arylamine N-acetyltransferase